MFHNRILQSKHCHFWANSNEDRFRARAHPGRLRDKVQAKLTISLTLCIISFADFAQTCPVQTRSGGIDPRGRRRRDDTRALVDADFTSEIPSASLICRLVQSAGNVLFLPRERERERAQ